METDPFDFRGLANDADGFEKPDRLVGNNPTIDAKYIKYKRYLIVYEQLP